MPITIIYGPQGCGKTRYAKAFMRYFNATRLVDDWDGRQPLQDGDLALTQHMPSYRSGRQEVWSAFDAQRAAGVVSEDPHA